MTTAVDLCARGFLPRELPPPFSSTSLASLVQSSWVPSRSQRTYQLGSHNLFRSGALRRALGIPNPLPFIGLAREVEQRWAQLQPLLQMSPWSLSQPTVSAARALEPAAQQRILVLARASARAGKRYAVIADVSRFYHSVYTHTIEWAVHTKTAVKQNRALPTKRRQVLWGAALDSLHREMQGTQSVGIPIGPDTSLLAAELLLARVDQTVATRIRATGFRYVDDYELCFQTLAEAERALSVLQECLTEYELGLNPTKTRIIELPAPLEASWTRTLRRIRVRRAGSGQRFDVVDLFDAAFELRNANPDTHVLRFTMGVQRHVTCLPQNWAILQSLLLQAMVVEPGTIREVLDELLRYAALGRALNRTAIAEALHAIVVRHAPLAHGSEVAWSVWAHIQLGIPLDTEELSAAEQMNDPVVALLVLDAANRSLAPRALNLTTWSSMMIVDELNDCGWLLAYEAAVKNWLPSGHLQRHPDFLYMAKAGVEFYQVLPASLTPPPWGGGGGGGGGGFYD